MRVCVYNRYDDSLTCIVELAPGGVARLKPGASKHAKEWLRNFKVGDAQGVIPMTQGERWLKAFAAAVPDSKLEA